MSDLISIASSGVLAYQRALTTISNNLANVATDGYTRQDVSLSAPTPRALGTSFVGTGVLFDGVRRQFDEFVEGNVRQSTSALGSQESLSVYTNRIFDLLSGDTSSLNGLFTRFFGSADALASEPASLIARNTFLRDGESLAAGFRLLHSQMATVQSDSRNALDNVLDRVNSYAEQIALLNLQLRRYDSEARQPPELLDQRDGLLRELSGLVQIRSSFAANGEVQVSISALANQGVIVDRDRARPVAAADNGGSGRLELVIDPYGPGREMVSGVIGGELGGLQAFREQVLLPTQLRLDDIAGAFIDIVNTVHRSGIDALGRPGGDLFTVTAGLSAAEGIAVATVDPRRVVAASRFRAYGEDLNIGVALASISYMPADYGGPASLTQLLPSSGFVSAPQAVEVGSGYAPVATIPAGTQGLALYLDPATGQWPQLITRDGRHLLGSALTPEQQLALLANPGMMGEASYSAEYLNAEKPLYGYLRADYFIGARAQPLQVPQYDLQTGAVIGTQALAARLQTNGIDPDWLGGLPAGAFKLNNVLLPALDAQANPLEAADLAAWINGVSSETGVVARAVNEIRLRPSELFANNVGGSTLSLSASDGTAVEIVAPVGGFATPADLVSAVNAESARTGIEARMSDQGEVVFSSRDGRTMQFDGTLLRLDGRYGGQLVLEAQDPAQEIRLTLGEGGSPDVLQRLGLGTALYWEGAVPEDLLLFVTGDGVARVSAAYQTAPFDAVQALRQQPMELRILEGSRYQLVDLASGSILAERPFDPQNLSIDYRGLRISLSEMPVAGDRFRIDGNQDGIGDNGVMRQIAALSNAPANAAGDTLLDLYALQSGRVGTVARQAGIAQEALGVVKEQALAARDRVSGVSLDEEAAELIRFQQAYQASAKSIQVATQLFDTILGVS